MAQYIDKDILMSQLNIELSNLRKAESEGYINEFGKGKLEGLEGIADFISNFCDKEADLEKRDIKNAFKAGYELGIQKAQKGGYDE
jgi:hypothetical protein